MKEQLKKEIIKLQELMMKTNPYIVDPSYRDGYIAACGDILLLLEIENI